MPEPAICMIERLRSLLPFGTSEMSCVKLRQLSSEYLEGSMDAGTLWRFRFHLERCGGCDAFVSTLRATIHTLNTLPPAPTPGDLKQRIAAHFPGGGGPSTNS